MKKRLDEISVSENVFFIIKEITLLLFVYQDNRELFYEKTKNLLKERISSEEVIQKLIRYTNRHCHNVINALLLSYPHLTSANLLICCLLCLNFSIDECCGLLGLEHKNAFYARTFRLGQKMRIDMPLNIFLKNRVNDLKNGA